MPVAVYEGLIPVNDSASGIIPLDGFKPICFNCCSTEISTSCAERLHIASTGRSPAIDPRRTQATTSG